MTNFTQALDYVDTKVLVIIFIPHISHFKNCLTKNCMWNFGMFFIEDITSLYLIFCFDLSVLAYLVIQNFMKATKRFDWDDVFKQHYFWSVAIYITYNMYTLSQDSCILVHCVFVLHILNFNYIIEVCWLQCYSW